ncbi:MAG: glycoside hydrolase [Gemmatimonadetes bacterium]|nr:glycoside hydrolase [Gemmatimonadota bacterium]
MIRHGGWMISTLVIALGLLPAGASAQGQQLAINDQGYLAKRGLNVLVFDNAFTGVFFDEKWSGMYIIQHGVRTAGGGAVRLSATPEQWDLVPQMVERKVDRATNTIEVTLRYQAYDFNSRMVVRPEGEGFNISVFVDKPVPVALEGHAGLNLEFRPTQYREHTYVMDGRPGIFPYYAAGPTASVPPEQVIPMYPSGHTTFDLHGHPNFIRALPLAAGKTLLMAPEDPARFVSIRSLSGDVQLIDGRNLSQGNWFVVRSLLATGITGKVAEWHIDANTIPDWTRTPNIGFSQVGYHPSQPKRAVIELDPNDTPLPTASLMEVRPDGSQVEKLKMNARPWGRYLRFNYLVADFSAVKDPGTYLIRYGTQQTGAFPIAENVYEQVWHPTLNVYIPVSMDHMFVNEAYRVWHGAAHMDDARMAPLNEQHFDGYRTGNTTNTPYGPGERVPGIAVGGWFDAGDFAMQGGHHGLMVATLAEIWETFRPQHDQTLVDQQLHFVDIHRPDGKPDVLQQLEHGALQVAAQFRTIGGLSRGVVDGLMHTYTHLGDASTQTDNFIYDPSLKPYEVRDGKSGTPDDRWIYMPSPAGTSYLGIDALAAASRTLRGFNDTLATECLELAEQAYAKARATPPPAQAAGPGRSYAGSETAAAMQLMITTKKPEYRDRFNELIWPALDQNSERNLTLAVRALPFMDAAYARRLRPYAERYRAALDTVLKANPYGVPIGTGTWAGNNPLVTWATTNYYLHKAYPDLFATDLVTRAFDYLFGTHPDHNYSFVSAVGNRPKHIAYGNNRADFTMIPGGIVPGVLILKPDFPENMDDWPFIWGENEYEISFSGSYIFLAIAMNEMLAQEARGTR